MFRTQKTTKEQMIKLIDAEDKATSQDSEEEIEGKPAEEAQTVVFENFDVD